MWLHSHICSWKASHCRINDIMYYKYFRWNGTAEFFAYENICIIEIKTYVSILKGTVYQDFYPPIFCITVSYSIRSLIGMLEYFRNMASILWRCSNRKCKFVTLRFYWHDVAFPADWVVYFMLVNIYCTVGHDISEVTINNISDSEV